MNGGDNRRRDRRDSRISKQQQQLILNAEEKLESKLGFDLFTEGDKRLGWLLTFASDGSMFKAKYKLSATKDKMEMDVDAYLRRRYEGHVADIEVVEKEDLGLSMNVKFDESLNAKLAEFMASF